jgi:hypothetical protein
MDTVVETLQAAEFAGLRAYARALLASLRVDDPEVVALAFDLDPDGSIRLELRNSSGLAVGGYQL